MANDIIAVYTDGGCIGENPSRDGGTWAYCFVNAAGERIFYDSDYVTPMQMWRRSNPPSITNNLTEMLALVNGLARLPLDWHGTVYSDSQISLLRLFGGWKWSNMPDWLVRRASNALQRLDLPNIRYVLLDGHPTKKQLAAGIGKRGNPVSAHNVWCDAECNRQAEKYREACYEAIPF